MYSLRPLTALRLSLPTSLQTAVDRLRRSLARPRRPDDVYYYHDNNVKYIGIPYYIIIYILLPAALCSEAPLQHQPAPKRAYIKRLTLPGIDHRHNLTNLTLVWVAEIARVCRGRGEHDEVARRDDDVYCIITSLYRASAGLYALYCVCGGLAIPVTHHPHRRLTG